MSLIQVVHVNKTLQEDSSHLRTFEGIACYNYKILYEEFEDTRGVIRIRKSKNYRQRNGQEKNDKQWSTKHTHIVIYLTFYCLT